MINFKIPAFLFFLQFYCVILFSQNDPVIIARPPKTGIPRYNEDYSYLKNFSSKNFYESIKYIPLSESSSLSFGGEARFRYEYFNNYALKTIDADNNGYLLERFLLHTDLRLGNGFYFYAQLQSSNARERIPGPRALDRNYLDLNQLFIDFKNESSLKFNLRIGRQEIFYGANRLFDYREGPNSRMSFTGVKLDITAPVNLSFFYLMPNKIKPDYFDDETEQYKNIFGVYFNTKDLLPMCSTDIYFVYDKFRADINYLNGDEERFSLGFRVFHTHNGFSSDIETTLQLASINGKNKFAYSLAADFNYCLVPKNDLLNAGVYFLTTSGASGVNSASFQSFYSSGANFRTIDLFGKFNLTYLQPYIQLKPLVNDKLIIDAIIYWRSSVNDNVYSSAGFILIDGSKFTSAFLGCQLDYIYTYYLNDFMQIEIGDRLFLSSPDIQNIGKAGQTNFVSFGVTLKF